MDLTKDPSVVPDPATTYVPEPVREAIETVMAKYPDVRSAAIPAMFIVQREHGWLSPTAMEQAACVLRLTPAYLVSVASFYDMFELTPKGKNDVGLSRKHILESIDGSLSRLLGYAIGVANSHSCVRNGTT